MRRIYFLIAAVLTVASMLLLAHPVVAAPPDDVGRAEHERIVRYWTPSRVARATPREMVIDVPGPQKGKPGGVGGGNGGGGNGGGGTLSVTGAPWTGGGVVKATTGKVLLTLGATDYVCSGSVVADARVDASIVLTAGHCVYDGAIGFASNWMFVPDYEDQQTFNCDLARYGCWTANALVTTTVWAAGDFDDDYAFAVVGQGGKSGETVLVEDAVGTQGIAFNLEHPRVVYAFGYPHASPYTGQRLIYCAGTDSTDTWGGSTDFGLKCDMTGGSSGGPWFADFDPATGIGTLNSVNSFKYRGGPLAKNMFGPYFDGYTQATYTAAQAAAGNLLVAPVP